MYNQILFMCFISFRMKIISMVLVYKHNHYSISVLQKIQIYNHFMIVYKLFVSKAISGLAVKRCVSHIKVKNVLGLHSLCEVVLFGNIFMVSTVKLPTTYLSIALHQLIKTWDKQLPSSASIYYIVKNDFS